MTMDDWDRVQCCHCLTQECYIHKLSFTPAVLTITHRKEQFVQDESTKRFTQRWSLQRRIIIQLNTRTNTLAEPHKTTHQSIRCIPAGSAWSVDSMKQGAHSQDEKSRLSQDFRYQKVRTSFSPVLGQEWQVISKHDAVKPTCHTFCSSFLYVINDEHKMNTNYSMFSCRYSYRNHVRSARQLIHWQTSFSRTTDLKSAPFHEQLGTYQEKNFWKPFFMTFPWLMGTLTESDAYVFAVNVISIYITQGDIDG